MKLLEKLKNTFFEEEYVEVEAEGKEEVVAKKVETKEDTKPTIKYNVEVEDEDDKEDKSEEEVDKPTVYSDRDLVRKNSKLPDFDDDDFVLDEYNKVETVEKPKKLYGEEVSSINTSFNIDNKKNTPYGAPIKGKFQPTPIISPIYGILDKNYKKEEVIDKKDRPSSYVSRRNADLDSIRKKAYGDVSILGDEKVTPVEEMTEDPLLYDMMIDDTKPVVDQVTVADAEEYFSDLGLEYNVDYKDGRYEKATGRRVSNNATDNKNDDTQDDANLDSNLFDLVDSMYEESE